MLANIIRNSKKSVAGGGGGIVIDGGDPYYSAVSLMLSMDGTNGSTTFTDSSLNALTVTATSATISTTQSKYGGASGYFGGSSYIVANNALLNISTGDFTVEGWIYFNSVASGQQPVSIYSGTSISFAIFTASSGTLNYYLSSSGSSWNIASGVLMGSVATSGWYHFAIVRSGSVFTPYLNGVSGTKTTSASNLNSQQQFVAGVSPNFSTGWFNGYLDDLRISRFARYVSNFTPPTAALPTTASSTVADPYYNYTSLLLHMDGTNTSTNFVDSGPNALAVTAVGNAQISTTQSQFGGAAAYFDGTGDYLSLSGGMPSGTGTAFTIECWIRLDDLSAYRSITRTAGGLDIGVQPNGLINCDQTSVGIIANSATGVITAGTWYHIAVTRDTSNNYKIYVNGTQVASATNAFSVTAATTIGYSAYSGSHYFKGYIDELRVTKYARYTSAFTPPAAALPEFATGNDRYFSNVSLLLHMDGSNGSTTFTDNSSNALAMTAVGTPTISTSQSVFGGASLSLNGSSYLTAANNASNALGLGDFTIECWVNFSATPANNAIMGIANVMTSASAATTTMWWLGLYNAAGTLRLQLGRHGNGLVYAYSNWTPSLNTWYHIAATRSSSSVISLFINGVSQSVTSSGSNWANDFSATGILSVGYMATVTAMNGYIDDFRLTKGVARYSSNFTPPTTAFPNA